MLRRTLCCNLKTENSRSYKPPASAGGYFPLISDL
jgi:hypothetical protein